MKRRAIATRKARRRIFTRRKRRPAARVAIAGALVIGLALFLVLIADPSLEGFDVLSF